MFHFLPVAIRYDGTAPQGHGYQVHVGPMYSDARGSVKIVSTDPRVHPALRFNYLSTDQDRREWVEAVRCARTILTQPAFDAFNGGELSPALGRDRRGDPRLGRPGRRDRAAPVLHVPHGDGRDVGRRPGTMRVHGLDGLRVVDASVMPYVTNGNIYAPVMMLAEKAADLILGNTPLPPRRPSSTGTPANGHPHDRPPHVRRRSLDRERVGRRYRSDEPGDRRDHRDGSGRDAGGRPARDRRRERRLA